MVDEPENDEPPIFKADTVPPPEGDDGDAYSAPTKVGPASEAAWAELIRKANEEGERSAAAGPPPGPRSAKPESSPHPLSPPRPPVPRPPVPRPPMPVMTAHAEKAAQADQSEGGVPRIYDEDDDDAATLLSEAARNPSGVDAPQGPMPPSHAAPFGSPPGGAPVIPVPPAPSIPPLSPFAARPLAFPPGDPAVPVPFDHGAGPYRRALVATAVVCLLVFVIGVSLFVFVR